MNDQAPTYPHLALAESTGCPDCMAPAGEHCRIQVGYPYHAARLDSARLRASVPGTCALCTRPMVSLTREDGSTDVFHPDQTDAAACPPIPDPNRAGWNAYADVINAGLSPGRPGAEHFRPVEAVTP